MNWQAFPVCQGMTPYGREVYTVPNDKTNRGYAFVFIYLEPANAGTRNSAL